MPRQIPARQPSLVGKQCVDACLRLRWIKNELGLPIFLQDRIIVVHGDRSVGVPVGGGADAKDGIVETIGERGRCNYCEDRAEEYSPEPCFQA